MSSDYICANFWEFVFQENQPKYIVVDEGILMKKYIFIKNLIEQHKEYKIFIPLAIWNDFIRSQSFPQPFASWNYKILEKWNGLIEQSSGRIAIQNKYQFIDANEFSLSKRKGDEIIAIALWSKKRFALSVDVFTEDKKLKKNLEANYIKAFDPESLHSMPKDQPNDEVKEKDFV